MLFPAAFLAVYLGLLWTPADYSAYIFGKIGSHFFLTDQAASFGRSIGQALINGFDISARVQNMTFYGFIYLPLLFLVIYGAICLLLRRQKDNIGSEAYSYINVLTWAGSAALMIQLFTRLSDKIFNYFSLIPPLMIILLIIYLRFFHRKIPLERFKWCLFAALALEVPAIIALMRLGMSSEGFAVPVLASSAAYFLLTLALAFVMILIVRRGRDNEFCAAFTPMMAAPAILSVFLELTNILNQHEIFISHKYAFSLLIFFLSILCCAALYWKYVKQGKKIPFDIAKWQYPLLILSFAMLLVLPSMQITATGAELFETSNYGSAIAGLFRSGQIPLVDNLNVHMLSDALGGILYGWLNGDVIGAIYLSYSIFTPIVYLLWYYFLKKITHADYAVLLVLLFPLTGLLGFTEYFGFGLLVLLAALRAHKNETKRSMLLFCLACAAVCLYRLDLGVMFAVGGVVALSVAFVVKKRKKAFLRLWITGICTVISGVGLFLLLCLARGVSPLARLLEFLDLMQSNVSWAYTAVANYTTWHYFFFYLVVPVALLCFTVAVFLKRKKEKALLPAGSQENKRIQSADCLIVAMLAISYMLNFQRAIVRHNIMESAWGILLATAPLCICIACYLLSGKKINVLCGCLGGVLLLQLVLGAANLSGTTLLQGSLNRQIDSTLYQEYDEKVERAVLSKELKNAYMPLKLFFDASLADDETFFDFTTQSLLYALTGREKPVYTNQSPSQLNSEYSHLLFIHEIETHDCPYAIVPSYNFGYDDISLRVNHYLVAEYLNQNYEPFCAVGGYQVWVKKDCYEQKKALIENLMPQEINLSYGLDSFTETKDTIAAMAGGSLVFENGTADPFADGFQNNAQLQQIIADSNNLKIKIDYTSTAAGVFQCFYTLQEGELYAESRSVSVPVNDNKGELTFSIPCTKNTRIRFDFPAGTEFTIEGIQCRGFNENDAYLASVQWIDYTYESMPHVYDTLNLAYYWGTYDKAAPQAMQRELCSGQQNVNAYTTKLDMSSLDLSKGNYIEILADSAQKGTASLRISGSEYGDLIDERFTVMSGTQNRYLIRISGDALWYSGLCDTLTLSSDAELNNVTIRILQGDVDYDGMNSLDRLALKQLSLLGR